MKKTRVALLFGGKSAEHEVSLQYAKNVYEAIDRRKYDVVLIGIDQNGKWHLNDVHRFLMDENDPGHIRLRKGKGSLALVPGQNDGKVIDVLEHDAVGQIDVVFPILHGPFGEDGTIQGLLRLAGIPFVGAGVLGSAVSMDKVVMKQLFAYAGIPHARFLSFGYHQRDKINYDDIERIVGAPFFVKPANLGSSVGIHKIHDKHELKSALNDAFTFDNKIIIEECIHGREIECSVLGNEDPIVSVPGEVKPSHEFYDYDAKYILDGSQTVIPADIPEDIVDSM